MSCKSVKKPQTIDKFIICLNECNNERISPKLKEMSPVQRRTHFGKIRIFGLNFWDTSICFSILITNGLCILTVSLPYGIINM